MPLKIKDDPEKEEIEIEGMAYSYDFFKFIAIGELGKIIRLIERRPKTVVMQSLDEKKLLKLLLDNVSSSLPTYNPDLFAQQFYISLYKAFE